MEDDDLLNQDICRFCQGAAAPDRPLFHPCICAGSIKFIHQDCLLNWLKYSKKEYCELCKHRFSFAPIYSPDMPKRLPIMDILTGLAMSMAKAIKCWFHFSLVALAWIVIVPLATCRIYRCLFTGSVSSLFKLPSDLLSTENLLTDIFRGSSIVTYSMAAFIGLMWLREQILLGGGPEWLEQDIQPEIEPEPEPVEPIEPPDEGMEQPEGAAAPAVENPDGIVGAENAAQDNNVNDIYPEDIDRIPEAVNGNNNDGNDVAVADDLNWNPMDWERGVEELTWERLLGLDGSLLFLEHAFWVISLNTMFILVFAFFPYHIGHFAIVEFEVTSWVTASHFEGLLTALCGYCVVGVILVFFHTTASLFRLNRLKRIFGLCYVVVKVALLSVVEIGLLPLIAGWWLDICSLGLFDSSLKDRESSFKMAPGTSMFIHWLVGVVYVFYFTCFILLLREVLRPGVLWFMRNLNDPNFNPVQEMIHMPILRHTRRFLTCMVIFGSSVLLMLWIPTRIIHTLWPSFLPYNVTLSSDRPMPVGELSLELLLLQIILPALLEQGHTRLWLKLVIKNWCAVVSKILGLRSYLLGDVPVVAEEGEVIIGKEPNTEEEEVQQQQGQEDDQDNPVNQQEENNEAQPENRVPVPAAAPPPEDEEEDLVMMDVIMAGDILGRGLGAVHQALLQRDEPTKFQPYVRPRWFGLRIFGLLLLMCISLTIGSAICLTIPVFIGRYCMYLSLGESKFHELYTGSCGLYICMLSIRGVTVICSWVKQSQSEVILRYKAWVVMSVKAVMALTVLAVIIPLMFGTLIELVIFIPINVPFHQTPILFCWQNWAMGVLYTKILFALVMIGPNWWLKTNLEQMIIGGLRNINLKLVIKRTGLPIIAVLGGCLALPYVFAHSFAPLFASNSALLAIERIIYPGLLVIFLMSAFIVWQAFQLIRLYEHIKNDKYLVGRCLVNYNHQQHKKSQSLGSTS